MNEQHMNGGKVAETLPRQSISPSPSTFGPQPSALILASASPRRRELLGRLGVPFEIVPSNAEEIVPDGAAPEAVAVELALVKARVVAVDYPGRVVIGADTVVAIGKSILGKPRDDAEAVAMLRLLRGRWHTVSTGVAVVRDDQTWQDVVTASVRMREYGDEEIARYVASGEPRDKAGAYAVQGLGGALVAEVRGSELTVVGLPLRRLAELLVAAGVDLPVDPAVIADRWSAGSGASD